MPEVVKVSHAKGIGVQDLFLCTWASLFLVLVQNDLFSFPLLLLSLIRRPKQSKRRMPQGWGAEPSRWEIRPHWNLAQEWPPKRGNFAWWSPLPPTLIHATVLELYRIKVLSLSVVTLCQPVRLLKIIFNDIISLIYTCNPCLVWKILEKHKEKKPSTQSHHRG